VGWVIEVKIDQLPLYKNAAWYTMIHHQGGGADAAVAQSISAKEDPIGYAKAQFAAVCAACHALDGSRLGPVPEWDPWTETEGHSEWQDGGGHD
jgi:mono/diheme cytochrome c family protein